MHACKIAARSTEAGDEAGLERICAPHKDNRNARGRSLRRLGGGVAPGRDNHAYLAANEIGRQRRQAIILTLRPAMLDRHVAAIAIASFVETLMEGGKHSCRIAARPGA